LDFGDGYQLLGNVGYYGAARGIFHGLVKSKFRIPHEMTFVVGAEKLPLFLLVPLLLDDADTTRDSVFTELSWAQIFEIRYAVQRERSFSMHEHLDVKARWRLGESTSLLLLGADDHHPRPSPLYATEERVRLIKVGYELTKQSPTGFISAVTLSADAGTAFVQSRYPQGKDIQVGVWGVAIGIDKRWSSVLSSSLAAEHQAAGQDINERVLLRRTSMTANIGWTL
jgi:hypothetical protein